MLYISSESPSIEMDEILNWDIIQDTLENIIKKIKPLDLILFNE